MIFEIVPVSKIAWTKSDSKHPVGGGEDMPPGRKGERRFWRKMESKRLAKRRDGCADSIPGKSP